jgi:hypothetical protein
LVIDHFVIYNAPLCRGAAAGNGRASGVNPSFACSYILTPSPNVFAAVCAVAAENLEKVSL